MNISVPTIDLNNAMRRVATAVGSDRSPLPAMSSVHLKAEGERLHLTTSNHEIEVSTSIAADVREQGEALMPFHKFASLINKLEAPSTDLAADKNLRLAVNAGRLNCTLAGYPVSDFVFMKCEAKKTVTVLDSVLGLIINTTKSTAPDDKETRHVFKGLFLQSDFGKIHGTVCGGNRVTQVKVDFDGPKFAALIPVASIERLLPLLDDDGEVQMALADNCVRFTKGDSTASMKVIVGEYPIGMINQILGSEIKHDLTVDRQELLSTIQRVVPIADEFSWIKIEMKFTKGLITIATAGKAGNIADEIAANYQGEDQTILINAIFVMDALKSIRDTEVSIRFSDHLSPFMIVGKYSHSVIQPLVTTAANTPPAVP